MFSHSVVFLLHLIRVVLRVLIRIHLLYFHRKNGLNFLRIQKSVAIDVMQSEEDLRVELLPRHVILLLPDLLQLLLRAWVVHFGMLLVLLLQLVVFGDRLLSFLFRHIKQRLSVSQLFLHFIGLEVFLSLGVQRLQVFGRRQNQFLQIFRFERVGIGVVQVFRVFNNQQLDQWLVRRVLVPKETAEESAPRVRHRLPSLSLGIPSWSCFSFLANWRSRSNSILFSSSNLFLTEW